MIVEILSGLARANLAAGAAILIVLALRRPARQYFGAQVTYALWAMPAMAAAASFLPHVTLLAVGPAMTGVAAAAFEAMPGPAASGLDPLPIVLGVWLAGVGAAVGLLAFRQMRFMASLGRLKPFSAAEPGVMRAEHAGVGPAVVGALRPRIVTPADFEARFAAEERRVILAHEAAHLESGDARINALAALAQCVAWFNPLVHLGVRRLRIDQELACDAAVLVRFPGARRLYAEVLLKTQLATQPLPLGCHWPAAGDHPLKVRIVMLKSAPPAPSRRALGLATVIALTLGGACASWATQPGSGKSRHQDAARHGDVAADATPSITKPRWIERPQAEDIAHFYPASAVRQGLSGDVLMTCRVDVDGRLASCAIARAVAQGPGMPSRDMAMEFGTATLQLAKTFQMEPERRNGVPVGGGVVRIPVRWRLPHGTAAAGPH